MLETTIEGPRGREHLCLNARDGRWEYVPETAPCPVCRSTGRVHLENCENCGGTGREVLPRGRDLVPVETVARLRERAKRDGTRRAVQAVA